MHGKIPLLSAPTPTAWLAAHLTPRLARHDDESSHAGRWLDVAALLADEGAELRAAHGRLVAVEVPPGAAASYLVGRFPAQLAWAVGFGLAAASAGFVVDPAAVRWRQHPGGWCDRVDLGAPRVVVEPHHPWAGQPEVVIGEPTSAAVSALVAAVSPIVERCHGLARVGMAGLWNEVGDALGLAVAHDADLPVEDRVVAALTAATALDRVPWRSRPELRIVESHIGPRYVGRKGGCCLAYTEPCGTDGPAYCSTCSFRTFEDARDRQLDWLANELDR